MERIVKKNLKVDFHIHSASSSHKDGNKVKDGTIANLHILVSKLIENKIDMVSISDHDFFNFDLYTELKKKEFDGTFMKVLPAIEFSVNFDSDTNPHNDTHVICIFDDSDNVKLSKINSYLTKKDGSIEYDSVLKFSESRFAEVLRKIDLDVVMIAHQKGSIIKDDSEPNDVANVGKWRLNEFIESEYFDSYEFKNPTNGIFNNLFKKKINKKYDVLRFITGTDCHVWKVYPQTDESEDGTDYHHTFLKCLPTFRGLSMSLTDDSRISLNENPFSIDAKKIDFISVKINNNTHDIPLSYGINVLIGDNSIGKSLFLHKITNYRYISSKQSLVEGYNRYLIEKNVEMLTSIDPYKIYKFDMQGSIRSYFSADNPGFNNDFLTSKYPLDVSCTPYIDYINDELSRLYAKIDNKFRFDDELKKLSFIQLITEDIKEKHLSVARYSVVLTDQISEKHKIFSAVDVAATKLGALIVLSITAEEKEYIGTVIKELTKLSEKYKKEYNMLVQKKTLLKIIDLGITGYNDHMRDYKSDVQNRYDKQSDDVSTLSSTVTQLIKLKAGISAYEYTIANKEIMVAKEPYGKYQFIKRFSNKKSIIDNQYYMNIIGKALGKDKKIDTKTITKIELMNIITNKTEDEKRKEPLQLLKDRVAEILTAEFMSASVILEKDKDVTDTLSQGLNSTIYFDIISSDKTEGIYIVDQPEDDISQSGIRESIIDDFKAMRNNRQIIIVTHNPQFVVNLDADNVICLEKNDLGGIEVKSGALEFADQKTNVLQLVIDHLDGGIESIRKRWKRYEKNIEIR